MSFTINTATLIDMVILTILIHWTVSTIVVEKMPGAFDAEVADVVADVAVADGNNVVLEDNNKGVAPIDTTKATMAIKEVVTKDNKKSVATGDAMATKAIKEEKVQQKDLNKVVDRVDIGHSTDNKASAKEQDGSEVKNLLSAKDAADTRAAADIVRRAECKMRREQELARLKRVHAIGMATAAASSVNLDRFAAQLEAAKARFEANKKEKKLAVLREHQGKAFARWVKRAAREEREEAVRSTIKAMQLRIEALELAVGANRAQEVQAASEEEEKIEETLRGERSELVKDVVKPAVGAQGPDVFTTGASGVEEAEEDVVAVAVVAEEKEERAAVAVLNREEVQESQEAQIGLPSGETQPMEGVAQTECVSMEEIAGDREENVTSVYEMEGQESYTCQVTIGSLPVVPIISAQLPVTPFKTPENALVIELPCAWREIPEYDDELVEGDDASTYGEDEEMDFIPDQDEESLEELVHAVEGLGLYEADIVMQPVVESSFAPELDMGLVHDDIPVEQDDVLALLARVATDAAREEEQAAEQREEEERQRQEQAWIEFLTSMVSEDLEQIPDNNTDIHDVGNVELEVEALVPESTTVQPWELFSLEDHMAFAAEAEAAAEPQEEQLPERENPLYNDEVDYRESDDYSGSDADAEGETDSEYFRGQREGVRGGYPSEDEDDTRSNGSSEDVIGRDAGGEREEESLSVGGSDSEEDEDEEEEEGEEEEERAQEEPAGPRFVRHAQQYEVVDDEVDERVREDPIVPRQDRVIRPLRRRPLASQQQQQVIDPEVLRMEAEAPGPTQEELRIRARYEIAMMRDLQDGVYDSDTDGEWDRVFADDDALTVELSALRARGGGEDS